MMSDNHQVLPSFPALRERTLRVLYGQNGGTMDKSPKGSVDHHIQSLVDCINQHESYATLSSCSGRIVLYDPGFLESPSFLEAASDEQDYPLEPSSTVPTNDSKIEEQSGAATKSDNNNNNNNSGKGAAGKWLMVSHDEVEPKEVLQHFTPDSPDEQEEADSNVNEADVRPPSSLCSFRFEPLLLHVAACNLSEGQELLQIAVSCGFRESGLVVTRQRVTVAIRTHSLTLVVPLSTQAHHPLRPDSKYLTALVEEANQRLRQNWDKLHKLETVIRYRLFADRPGAEEQHSPRVNATITKSESLLPSLNLYGHATVAVNVGSASPSEPSGSSNKRFSHLLVFGGYGAGPIQASPSRSSRVYSLKTATTATDEANRWDEQWKIVVVESGESKTIAPELRSDKTSLLLSLRGRLCTLETTTANWGPRQGGAAIALGEAYFVNGSDLTSPSLSLVLLFGGRQGPSKPLNDLLIFQCNYHALDDDCRGRFVKPFCQGRHPAARWGHTLTSLLSDTLEQLSTAAMTTIPIAVLVGGRNENATHFGDSTISLLSVALVPPNSQSDASAPTGAHLIWEHLSLDSSSLMDRELCCRFHHSAVALDKDHVLVFGGLSNLDNMLESFAPKNSIVSDHSNDRGGDFKHDDLSGNATAMLLTLRHSPFRSDSSLSGSDNAPSVTTERIACSTCIPRRFGHVLNCLNTFAAPNQHKFCYTLLLSGGVSLDTKDTNGVESDDQDNPLQLLKLSRYPNVCTKGEPNAKACHWSLVRVPVTWSGFHGGKSDSMDLGVLVHHCCLLLESTQKSLDPSIPFTEEVVMTSVGGGAMGFAFQELFAPSHRFSVGLTVIAEAENEATAMRITKSAEKRSNSQYREQVFSSTLPSHATEHQSSLQVDVNSLANVLYVLKSDAKRLKTFLENKRWLDKSRRMTDNIVKDGVTQWLAPKDAADMNSSLLLADCVAVPVVDDCVSSLPRAVALKHKDQCCADDSNPAGSTEKEKDWTSWLVGYGRQVCPPSSSAFARHTSAQKNRRASQF